MAISITKEVMMSLQNGSDIRGAACAGVEGQAVNLTGEAVCRIARAFVRWLAEKKGCGGAELTVGVGHDSRITAKPLSEWVLKGLEEEGATAVFCGLATTPSMFMGTVFEETQFHGSLMITASHLPFNRNGIKFFDRDGGLEKADITWILEQAAALEEMGTPQKVDDIPQVDLLSIYAGFLCGKIREAVKASDFDHPLAGLHIIVDAGNGAGGFFAEQVLGELGADFSGSQYLEPDGMFPNHVPNPENAEAMKATREAVLSSQADLGLCFDTDADRMSAVLSDGTEINRDAMIAMMAAILAPDYPGGTIVTDSVTSDKLTAFLQDSLGLKHHRFKRGYKNVINESKRLNGKAVLSPLAMETSGHGALSENYFLDDGAYLAVKLLIAAARTHQEGKGLASLIEGFEPPFECGEYRIKIKEGDAQEYGKQVLMDFERRAKERGISVAQDSYEGVRLTFEWGWILLRMSLHDPLMPLNLEGNRPGDCEKLKTTAFELLKDCKGLELSVLS